MDPKTAEFFKRIETLFTAHDATMCTELSDAGTPFIVIQCNGVRFTTSGIQPDSAAFGCGFHDVEF